MGPIINQLKSICNYLKLPTEAKVECNLDRKGLQQKLSLENVQSINSSIAWLCRAQDLSTSKDGGVARHYSLLTGWSSSYPETTGYIIPTFINLINRYNMESEFLDRSMKMLNWLFSIQFANGAFQGGRVDSIPKTPVVFNTGQILIGLSYGVKEFDIGLSNLQNAANWLCKVQDPDGCWRKYQSPFASKFDKTYDTHVAWGLLEAAKIENNSVWIDKAHKNISWALTKQIPNGWFENCCLNNPSAPLTHTIGYALRGVIEGYIFFKESLFLNAAIKSADSLLKVMDHSGFIPGRLNNNWEGEASWACLTGTMQIACCWFLLYKHTRDKKYLSAGILANEYVKRTLKIAGNPNMIGGIKGSFPVNGGYGTYQYLNWACKFFIDSLLLEEEILGPFLDKTHPPFFHNKKAPEKRLF